MKKIAIHPLKIDFEIPISSNLMLPRFVYIFIIEGEKLHFIDTGVASGFNQIESFIISINRQFSDIQSIILTHAHPDHIGTAKLIQDKISCTTYAPENEISWIEDIDLQYKERPVPGFHQLVAGAVKIDHVLQDNTIVQPEKDITLHVTHTPGHSSGSTSFYYEEEKALFSGDSILLPGELPIFVNIKEYISSLQKIEQLHPQVLYSAWDKPRYSDEIPDIIEKSKDYILNIQKIVQQVARNFHEVNSIDFCKAVLQALGQNENMANPLLLTSFLASLAE